MEKLLPIFRFLPVLSSAVLLSTSLPSIAFDKNEDGKNKGKKTFHLRLMKVPSNNAEQLEQPNSPKKKKLSNDSEEDKKLLQTKINNQNHKNK